MNNLEKLFWLGMAGYGAYSAGKAFSNHLNSMEKRGVNAANVLILTGLGAAFLIRLETTAKQAEILLSS